MISALVDPRVNNVKDIFTKTDEDAGDESYNRCVMLFKEEHRMVYNLIHGGIQSNNSLPVEMMEEAYESMMRMAAESNVNCNSKLLGPRIAVNCDIPCGTEAADMVVDNWLKTRPNWMEVIKLQTNVAKKGLLPDEVIRAIMAFNSPTDCSWKPLGLYEHVDILRWFKNGGCVYPTIALMARIYLGRMWSSAFQERVFSTGEMVMNIVRNKTDRKRAEKQLLLTRNREFVNQHREMFKVAKGSKKAKKN